MTVRVEAEADGESDKRQAVTDLRAAVSDILEAHAELGEWCDESTLRRYLAARSFNVAQAKKMLLHTLEWRRTYKPHEIKWQDIEEEATGKQFVMPCTDKHGRTVVIMRPRHEQSSNPDGQIRFLVYTLEQASKRADASGQGKLTWLIDFKGYSMRNAPSIRVSLATLSILQSHYPERLGMALCYFPPRLFSFTWKAVHPWIDPLTAKKVVFVDSKNEAAAMAKNFDMHDMEACLGGKGGYTYDPAEYSKFCRLLELGPQEGSTATL